MLLVMKGVHISSIYIYSDGGTRTVIDDYCSDKLSGHDVEQHLPQITG
jgi:hypothetical protein